MVGKDHPAAVSLPRLVIAAPASGHGKTTIATGLMAALTRAGHDVSCHKVGPDYIDPGYHALATGRPGRNLDPHLVGEERLVPLLLHGATGADLAVIEGVSIGFNRMMADNTKLDLPPPPPADAGASPSGAAALPA